MGTPGGRRARLGEIAQVARVHLAPFPHPVRCRALVGDPHLVGRIAQQPPDDRGPDRAGATGDEHSTHDTRARETISEA